MEPVPVKPGYLTTEFWITVFANILGSVIAVAGLFGHNLDGSKLQPLVTVAAMLAVAIATGWYSHTRSTVKSAALVAAIPVNSTIVVQSAPVQEPQTGETPPRSRSRSKTASSK